MFVGLFACSSDDTTDENGTEIHHGYRVSIQAEMDPGTRALNFGDGTGSLQASFAEGEKVYVCNVSNNYAMDEGYLQASSDGQTVTLNGTLQGTYEVGNELRLFYHADSDASGTASEFSYTGQNGTSTSAASKDFAVATVYVGTITSGTLETTSTAYFKNIQNFLCLSFNFTDWDGTAISTPSGISSLTISSANNSIATAFAPLTGTYTKGDITLTSPDLDNPIYVAIPFDETASSSSDNLTITATTSAGIQYQGTKSAPSTGFKNGKYYSASAPVTLSKTTKTITVGIISYRKDYSHNVHTWREGEGAYINDVTLVDTGNTEERSLGNDYWSNKAQTFYMFTAEIPKDLTGYKVCDTGGSHYYDNNNTTTGTIDASKAYVFEYSGVYHVIYE